MVAWYALSLYNGSVPRGKDKEKDLFRVQSVTIL